MAINIQTATVQELQDERKRINDRIRTGKLTAGQRANAQRNIDAIKQQLTVLQQTTQELPDENLQVNGPVVEVADATNNTKPVVNMPPVVTKTWKSSDGKYEFENESSLIEYERILATQQSETAAEKARAARLAAETTRSNMNAREFLLGTLRQYFVSAEDTGFVTDLERIIDDYIRQDYDADTISVLLPQTEPYKKRFAGNQQLVAAGVAPLSPAEYLQAESQYTEILKRYDLGSLARRDTFSTLIGGQVSAAELTDRVVNVYDRVRNADPALKAEMERVKGLSRGQLTDADFAKALLTGAEGANELKRKISTAEISAEARQRQLSTQSAEQLQQLGVTREQARAGFETISQAQPTFEKLAGIYDREQLQPAVAQTELEREVFQGMESQRRKRLAQQEAAAFSGSSGLAGSALSTQRAGQI